MSVMGRRIPDDHNLPLIHSFVYLSFLVAGLAASMAVITALCSVRSRKKSSPPPSLSETTKDLDTTETAPPDPEPSEDTTETGKELPLPPAMHQPVNSSPPINMKRAASERRLSFNLSIKMPRTFSVARHKLDHKEDNIKKGKLKTEDSVWMKTIILGEKCQVPEDEEAVIYEGKGKKVAAYHPKAKTSMSLSRQLSFETDVPQGPQTQEDQDIDKS